MKSESKGITLQEIYSKKKKKKGKKERKEKNEESLKRNDNYFWSLQRRRINPNSDLVAILVMSYMHQEIMK